MSQEIIQALNAKIKSATRARSKEIKLKIEECNELVLALNDLLLELNNKNNKIIELQESQSILGGSVEVQGSKF